MEDFEEIRDALLHALEALVTRHVSKIADASRENAERVARQQERIDALEREIQGKATELVEMARDARLAGEQHAAAVSSSFDAGWNNGRLALQRDVDEKLERSHVRVQVAEAAVEGLGKENRQLSEALAKATAERDRATAAGDTQVRWRDAEVDSFQASIAQLTTECESLRAEVNSAANRLCSAIEWPREGMALTGCVDVILDALNERGRLLRLKTDSSEWLRNAVVELGKLVGAGDSVTAGERYVDAVVRICKERLEYSDRLRSDLETVRKFAQDQVVQHQDEARGLQAEIRKRDEELVTSRTETKRIRADLAAEMQAHLETKAKLADVEGRLPGVEMDSSVEAKALTPQEDGRWSRGIWIPGGQAQDEIFAKDAMDALSSDGVVPKLAAIALDGLAMVPAELRDAKHRKLCDDLAKAAGWPIETCRLEGMATEPEGRSTAESYKSEADALFEDLPLDSRVDVVYERDVHVESLADVVTWTQTMEHVPLERHPSDLAESLPGWYAVVDSEGDLVCIVPPGGIDRDSRADNVVMARAGVVAAMLNQAVDGVGPEPGIQTEDDIAAKLESLARNAEAASQAILALEKRLAAVESIGRRPV